jgi:ubiquinone/menaquinone biosynthesis C-methylase UbiE
MTDTIAMTRTHYGSDGLTARLARALEAIATDGEPLKPAQLAAIDQFHTRGLQATMELASLVSISPTDRVLDVGAGLGGPARYLAVTFGCCVHGVDLSPDFVDAAAYLTRRCGLAEKVSFAVGDALDLRCEDGAFDVVLLQHVAMNVADRAALYAGVRRALAPGGRFATFDIVERDGPLHFPVPWARDPDGSCLLSEPDTRAALEATGFKVLHWRDDTPAARDWFAGLATAAPRPGALGLGLVMGSDFPALAGNLARNIAEGRAGVLLAVLARD